MGQVQKIAKKEARSVKNLLTLGWVSGSYITSANVGWLAGTKKTAKARLFGLIDL